MYQAAKERYDKMKYVRCGKSGVLLPRISLGLWHNFGSVDHFENQRQMIRTAFDYGITHFDLANNYGPIYGSAEENFGRIMQKDMLPYRDEMFISTKAGYDMWEGPYGNFGSRKYLMASLDQSLKRMGLPYVDVFYHHRPDSDTPLEETMEALSDIVRQGKALYVGLSNYTAEQTGKAAAILRNNKTPLLIHQPRYSMLNRLPEEGLLDTLEEVGAGCICFSPLAQGMLTDRYLQGIPQDSRAAKAHFLKPEDITEEKRSILQQLNAMARQREQSLAQMALAWALRGDRVTSVLIGASRPEQILDNIRFLENLSFTEAELAQIEGILNGK